MIYLVSELLLIANSFERLAASKKQVGTIYLIHFDEPVGNLSHALSQASHYMGWTSDLDKRLDRHRLGQGSSLMRHVEQSGIRWSVVRTWQGTRDDERALKNQKNSKRYCPVCLGSSG
jgi:predicted GIY-YIG superfamily endonuclease